MKRVWTSIQNASFTSTRTKPGPSGPCGLLASLLTSPARALRAAVRGGEGCCEGGQRRVGWRAAVGP